MNEGGEGQWEYGGGAESEIPGREKDLHKGKSLDMIIRHMSGG